MNRLRELRKSNNLSMKEFGLKFGLAESTISLYETGKRFPDPQQLIAFANYFNVSIDYLLGREDSFGAPYPYDTQNRPEQKKPIAERQAKTEKTNIQLIFDNLNPRQQANLLAYAEGMLAANDTSLEELKRKV